MLLTMMLTVSIVFVFQMYGLHLFSNKNLPMQYTEIFSVRKIENDIGKIFDIFNIFALNIDCCYTLEPPRKGGSNELLQSMFWG